MTDREWRMRAADGGPWQMAGYSGEGPRGRGVEMFGTLWVQDAESKTSMRCGWRLTYLPFVAIPGSGPGLGLLGIQGGVDL